MWEWLEIEEVTGRFWHRWASRSASWPSFPEAAVSLDSVRPVLGVFFRAAGGDPALGINPVAAEESAHRLNFRQWLGQSRERQVISRRDQENLLLPAELSVFPERALNRDLYFWLAAHAACLPVVPSVEDPLHQDVLALHAALEGVDSALAQFPGLAPRYRRLAAALLPLRPQRSLPSAEQALEALIVAALAQGAGAAIPERWQSLAGEPRFPPTAPRDYRPPLPVPLWATAFAVQPGGAGRPDAEPESTESAATSDPARPGRRKAQRRRQDQAEREDPLVFNRFEKLLSMAEMVNVNRLVDDEEDENAARNAEQLEEITLSPHRQQAAAKLRLELDLPAAEATGAPLAARLSYPEWHYRERRYLQDHCVVLAGVQECEGERWQPDLAMRRRIRQVRRQFEALQPRRVLLRGQPDGDQLDIDAVVRAAADQRACGQSSDRLYQATREQDRDLAVSVLVDVSLSTEAWLEDRRVLDVEKEAVLVLAHGIAACGDAFAIHSFTSRRREKVWVNTLKDWAEGMDRTVEQRIQALQPGSYTRMGPAIRHLAAGLAKQPQRHRLLLLLTDGKPNDTDYYEGRYAVEDTRRAVLDARQSGVRVFAVTIDQEAQQYFQRIFSRGGYSIVQRPEHLAVALPAIYRQIIRH